MKIMIIENNELCDKNKNKNLYTFVCIVNDINNN